MAIRNRLHIIVPRLAATEQYTSHQEGRGSPRPPAPIDRHAHGLGLAADAEAALATGIERRRLATEAQTIDPAGEGVHLTFDSLPGFQLELTPFDPQNGKRHPELVAVQTVGTGDDAVERATVFVPDGSLSYFLRRFEQYATEETAKGAPRHQNFVERIAAVRMATIQALWTDAIDTFPSADALIWWEVWLRRTDGKERERLTGFAHSVSAQVGDRHLVFDNRVIILIQATATQLASALDLLDDLAELRRAKITAEFFAALSPNEQAEWARDLVKRTRLPDPGAPAVCVLDTGVNREHPLLVGALAAADTQSCHPTWGTHDHDGHGTEMAGLALYGDLTSLFDDGLPLRLRHRLESVKLLPPPPQVNRPELYAAVTAEAVSRPEIQAPRRRRVFSMAVTAPADEHPGTPTLWSSAIDALAAGRAFDSANGELRYIDKSSIEDHRALFVSAGNVRTFDETPHLDRSDLEPVEDPAQAWNAVTVGAYTELVDVAASGSDYDGWSPVAPTGELSPHSRTSVTFARQWPIKPEIVLEGGNTARSSTGDIDWPGSLQVLTTNADAARRLLTTSFATSASTAQAARMAAIISTEYPGLWPETVRASLIHAAEWSPAMRHQFAGAGEGKTAREALVRRYGFGVPSLDRALRSAGDALTLIVQDTIRPYEDGRLREMHVHDLPWPVEALEDLGAAPVCLRLTLSYFIEPNATRRGWKRRYRYASHGLRFELKLPAETNDEFRKRLNRRALAEDEGRPVVEGDVDGWFLGSRARNRGSLHSDFWCGTAAELAARGRVAIFPVTGWWKEQPKRDRSEIGVRYGLVISIETPVETADLWTPVAQQVGLPITVTV